MRSLLSFWWLTGCQCVAPFLSVRPLSPTHNSILANSTYLQTNDNLASSDDPSSYSSRFLDTYWLFALPETFNPWAPSDSFPPLPFSQPEQYQTLHGYNEELNGATNNYYPDPSEVFHNGTVNPADLHWQADHTDEGFNTGVEINEDTEAQEEPVEREPSVSVAGISLRQRGRTRSRVAQKKPYQQDHSLQPGGNEYYRIIKVESNGTKPTYTIIGDMVVCWCGKKYKTKDNLVRHSKKHQQRDKEYECKFCSTYRSERSDVVLKHARLCKPSSH
ncbi:hypothetical protein BDV93DRAFT_503540 [Ceratobasidium sp. AG-I]|nr:hypothetical protein BDV93DRAFT_503540 [Ceratobasidium sp. AG-I]